MLFEWRSKRQIRKTISKNVIADWTGSSKKRAICSVLAEDRIKGPIAVKRKF